MARGDRDPDIVPSVLDRLLDDQPDLTHEAVTYRIDDLRGLKRSVARDLEAMLNTRQEALEELPAGSYSRMPKTTRHFGMAKGETIIQFHGTGPFEINYVNPADDPRKKGDKK